MAKFNFNLRVTGGINKKGHPLGKTSTPIRLLIRWDGKKLVYSTKQSITPIHWNKDNQRARNKKDCSNWEHINKNLDNIESTAKEVFIKNNLVNGSIEPNELKNLLDIELGRLKKDNGIPVELLEYIDFYKSRLSKRINPKTNKIYSEKYLAKFKQLKDLLNEIDPKTNFKDVNMDLYYKIDDAMELREASINTHGSYIKTLCIIMNASIEDGINTLSGHKHKHFVILKEKSDSIALSEKEISKLYNLDLSNKPSLERDRDLFIVGCHTGLRFEDLTNITKNNILENGNLRVRASKNGKDVEIPFNNELEQIFAKYNYNLPKSISNQKFNNNLKEIGKLANLTTLFTKRITKGKKENVITKPKYEFLTAHASRRSFCTNLYLQGFSTIGIMAISLHTSESDFLKYIKVTKSEHANRLKEHRAKINVKNDSNLIRLVTNNK